MSDDSQLAAFAGQQGLSEAALRALIDGVRAQAGADHYYVFWTPPGGGGRGAARERLLLAFPTPDAALAFAQRNQLAREERPRLRRLALAQLIRAVLREPAIRALLLVAQAEDGEAPPGQLPRGTRIERAALLQRLAEAQS